MTPRHVRKSLGSVAAAALLAAGLAGAAAPDARAQQITIGSNPQGSLYYVVGGGLAALFSEAMDRPAIVQPYAGSSVYLPLIANGEVTAGLSSSLDSGRAFRGVGDAEALTDLRAVARLWPLAYGYMVRAEDGLDTVADLEGRRVVVEIRANAALEAANRAILATAGLDESTVDAVAIGNLPQGTEGVVEGSIDATSVAVGIPLTRQAHASISGGIAYAAVTGDNATDAFLESQLPGLYMLTVEPSDARPGVQVPTPVVGFDVFLVADADTPDADIAGMLDALSDGFGQLQEDYPALRSGSADLLGAPTNTVPYHPAAVAWFEEQGLWTDVNADRDAGFGN
jgi:hypothetical protein